MGSGLSGWQRQKNAISIQQLIEDAILKITAEKVSVTGCSRTDAGVHAEEFIANFRTSSKIPTEKFAKALQTKLPRAVHLLRSREVSSSFNARRNSFEKTYRYQIYEGFSPFRIDRWWQLDDAGDLTLLQAAALQIKGKHDFSGFCVMSSLKSDNHCSIKQAAWRRKGRELYFHISGDRFLHRMVRFLVGAQVELARGEMEIEDFQIILNRPQRKRALYPAPPEGLYLMKVKYRE